MDERDVRHPADARRFLAENPSAYVKQKDHVSPRQAYAGGYYLIRPGTFAGAMGGESGGYVCVGIPDQTFQNLEEHDLTEVEPRKWSLK